MLSPYYDLLASYNSRFNEVLRYGVLIFLIQVSVQSSLLFPISKTV